MFPGKVIEEKKCRHFLFLKMCKFKHKNPRNTIYKEKWQLEKQRLTAINCVTRKGAGIAL